MDKEPFCFSLGSVRLVRYKGADFKFGRIDRFSKRVPEELKCKLEQRRKAGIFLDVGSVVFFDSERLKVRKNQFQGLPAL